MIQENMKKAQDRQKSYEDHRRRPLEFGEGGHVFLKVTPRWKLKGTFKSLKLSLRYIGTYKIIGRINEVSYRLDLPGPLFDMHDVFHVFQLQQFIPDPLQPVLPDIVDVEAGLSLKPQPSHILERAAKTLRNKEIPLVKVLWEGSHPDK
ncbi:uncharacterized protein LOC127136188 [Lathyrus oleraceus]|uniref:uncharacterized protein LOC127136188 n=1 Tax=Pisum sativum TaxID=3888 RepID=UPI0021D3DF90|nr:uncharacterized protein LOC127136188 [Pisum sativum]